ncbi:Aste57867_19532 [Aphanomyces stellatus]|uniref:Aste57867_19532 protein n=1 Tax=Aphanomyces stellatus TaxID=120398 RepID=A0A485LDI1_9STRA|nr:hypothetical protein As57867_019468 [Aphanomyces stellatus]VFT96239.1 Aste57867_19532 [Aphanomyces stellatus]
MEPIREDEDHHVDAVVTTPRGSKRVQTNHRRVKSIVVGGSFELEKIKKEHEVETLHSELEKQNKALEESQEETQLAARIGQSLLLQNQQLDYEMETKVATLKQKSEDAEAMVKAMEAKMHDMTLLHREMELNQTKLVRENECLVYDLTQLKATVKPLKDELAKTKDDLHLHQLHALRHTTDANDIKVQLDESQAHCAKLTAENETLVLQLNELQDMRQESDLHFDQMVASLETTTHELAELRVDFRELSEKHTDTIEQLEALTMQHRALQDEAASALQQVDLLTSDLAHVTELLDQEQQGAEELLTKYDELVESVANGSATSPHPSSQGSSGSHHARQPSNFFVSSPVAPLPANVDASHVRRPSASSGGVPKLRHGNTMGMSSPTGNAAHSRKPSEFDCSTMLHQESTVEKRRAEVLKRGSLFHELSRELEKEFQKAKLNASSSVSEGSEHNDIIACTHCPDLMAREAALSQEVASLTLELQHLKDQTTQRPLSSDLCSIPETVSTRTSPTKPRRSSLVCPTCPELMKREATQSQLVASLSLEVAHLKAQVAAMPEPLPEEDVLKEFFVLTATAIKLNGGGLKNNRCNIANDVLFDQAMDEGISFEKFSSWISTRLDVSK